jgi:hypothetical protein
MASPKRSTPKCNTPTGPYHQFLSAVRAAGATKLCPSCYAFVLPMHETCPDWRALGLAAYSAEPVILTLEGGLVAEPAAELAEVA